MYKLTIVMLSLCSILMSCRSGDSTQYGEAQQTDLVDAKYSVAKDRAEFEKLREAIPAETRKQNDEKALTIEWMSQMRYSPEVIREKFNKVVRKKRDLFNKDMTRKREEFNRNEKKAREEFTRNLEDDRKDFLRRKVDREKSKNFFDEQDRDRKTFNAELKDKRDNFEADVKEKRKNFDDYIKERNDDFNAELKDYAIRLKEKIEQEKEK